MLVISATFHYFTINILASLSSLVWKVSAHSCSINNLVPGSGGVDERSVPYLTFCHLHHPLWLDKPLPDLSVPFQHFKPASPNSIQTTNKAHTKRAAKLHRPFDSAFTAAQIPLFLQPHRFSAPLTCYTMPIPFPLTLPYGLSDMHRQNHARSKAIDTREGAYTIETVPGLHLLSRNTIFLPVVENQHRSDSRQYQRAGSIKVQVRKRRKSKMGVGGSRDKKKDRKTTISRRERTPKVNNSPILQTRSRSEPRSTASKKSPRKKRQFGPGTRNGESKDRPIILTDEDENPQESQHQQPGFFQSASVPTRNSPSTRGFYEQEPQVPPSRYGSAPVGARRTANETSATLSPTLPYNSRHRAKSIYEEEPRSDPPIFPPALRNSKARPGAYKPSDSSRTQTIFDAHLRTQPLTSRTMSDDQHADGDGQISNLGNISDLAIRRNVAQLMAVAPGLPIQDLYDLLIDLGGDFSAAKKHAIRASRAPSAHPSIKEEPPIASDLPARNLGPEYDYGDEVMVKVDPNEDFLEWDSDASPEPELHPKRPVSKKSKPRPSKLHSSQKTKTKSKSNSNPKNKPKPKPNISVRRTDPKPRDNSLRTFVVPNNVVEFESDVSSSTASDSVASANDSDVPMSGMVDEDLEDLEIDMKPRYVYNGKVLAREERRGKGR